MSVPRTRAGDCDRQQDRNCRSRCAQKKKQNTHVECVLPCRVKNGGKIVGEECAAGGTSLEAMPLPGYAHEGRLWIAGKIRVIELGVDLRAHAIRANVSLWIEKRVPSLEGQNDDIVGRRLRLSPGRRADHLKHRVGIRQVDDASNRDANIRQSQAVDSHDVPRRHMKVGCRLLSDQHAFELPEKRTDVSGEIGDIARIHAEHLARSRHLHGAACRRLKPIACGIADGRGPLDPRCGLHLGDDGFGRRRRAQLDLPIDWYTAGYACRHLGGA